MDDLLKEAMQEWWEHSFGLGAFLVPVNSESAGLKCVFRRSEGGSLLFGEILEAPDENDRVLIRFNNIDFRGPAKSVWAINYFTPIGLG